jgi:hypothetical protein
MFPVSFHTFVMFAKKVLFMCSFEVQKILLNYCTLCCIFCASEGKYICYLVLIVWNIDVFPLCYLKCMFLNMIKLTVTKFMNKYFPKLLERSDLKGSREFIPICKEMNGYRILNWSPLGKLLIDKQSDVNIVNHFMVMRSTQL